MICYDAMDNHPFSKVNHSARFIYGWAHLSIAPMRNNGRKSGALELRNQKSPPAHAAHVCCFVKPQSLVRSYQPEQKIGCG